MRAYDMDGGGGEDVRSTAVLEDCESGSEMAVAVWSRAVSASIPHLKIQNAYGLKVGRCSGSVSCT